MRTQMLAALAAACGVLTAWEALGMGAAASAHVARVLAPLRSGGEPDRTERRRLVAMVVLAVLSAAWMLGSPWLGMALGAAVPWATRQAIGRHRRRRREQLVDGAPAVARGIADALAGGHSIQGAIGQARAGGVSGVARFELERAATALELGDDLAKVLERLRATARHPAYDALCAAIMLQRQAGGDLAGLLRRLAAGLDDQARAAADARSITAQARFTALLVAGLPCGAVGLAELAAPGSIVGLLRSPMSAALVAGSVVLQGAAWLVIRRIGAFDR